VVSLDSPQARRERGLSGKSDRGSTREPSVIPEPTFYDPTLDPNPGEPIPAYTPTADDERNASSRQESDAVQEASQASATPEPMEEVVVTARAMTPEEQRVYDLQSTLSTFLRTAADGAVTRGTREFDSRLDLALQQNDIVGNFDRAVDRAGHPTGASDIDPAVDAYLTQLYATRDAFESRLRDPKLQIGTDQSYWLQSPASGIQGQVMVRPDGSYVIEDGGYLKPLSNGQALMAEQQQAFERLDRAYDEIPVGLRQKSLSAVDMLTLVSLAAGAGEVLATMRGATTLARVLGGVGNATEYASDIARKDYSGFSSDVALNQVFDQAKNRVPGRPLKAAVTFESLSLDVTQAAQRLPTPSRSGNPNATMSDRDWALLQGINPLAIESTKP
jgi:hypothetical protein